MTTELSPFFNVQPSDHLSSLMVDSSSFIKYAMLKNQLLVVNFSLDDDFLNFFMCYDFQSATEYKTTRFERVDHFLDCRIVDQLQVIEVKHQVYLLVISSGEEEENNVSTTQEYVFHVQFDMEKLRVDLKTLYKSNDVKYLRCNVSPIADSKRNCLYLVGGLGTNYRSSNNFYREDIVKFDIEKCEWEHFDTYDMYSAMYNHSSVFWKDTYIIVFGGFLSSCCCTCNILAFNVEKKEWSTLYSIFNEADQYMPLDIYPRFGSGMCLVSNKWASQFDKSIPNNLLQDTLCIYGGCIDTIISEHKHAIDSEIKIIRRNTHEIYLFHLDETEWCFGYKNHYQCRIPFNLTEYCTPNDRKLEKIHRRVQKQPKYSHCGFQEDDQDDSAEFKILPVCGSNFIFPLMENQNINSLIVINSLKPYNSISVTLNSQTLFTNLSTAIHKLSDITIK